MATKKKDHERLEPANIEKAIALLENKGTKKAACELLNIAYNTTRLNSIIEKYLADKAREAERRAEKRGKPASESEITYVIKSYLEGDTVEAISKSLYRGSTFVTSILHRYGVPLRKIPHDYRYPGLVPEEAMRDKFKIGEKVYSMRYDSLASIEREFKPGIYAIWLISDKWQQYAYQPAEELASLDHLKEVGVEL